MNARERVLASMDALGDDELEVLAEVADGLVAGRKVYGDLNLDTDGRDFLTERIAEHRDALSYLMMDAIRMRRARAQQPASPTWPWPVRDPADAPPGARVLYACKHGVGDKPCALCCPEGR